MSTEANTDNGFLKFFSGYSVVSSNRAKAWGLVVEVFKVEVNVVDVGVGRGRWRGLGEEEEREEKIQH